MSSNILHFANVQKSNTCKKWAPPHTSLANLDTCISTKSHSSLSLLLCLFYKIGLWESSILMPNSLFKQLWCNLICVCTSPQRHVRCLWPTVAVTTILCWCTVHYWAPVVLLGGGQPHMHSHISSMLWHVNDAIWLPWVRFSGCCALKASWCRGCSSARV